MTETNESIYLSDGAYIVEQGDLLARLAFHSNNLAAFVTGLIYPNELPSCHRETLDALAAVAAFLDEPLPIDEPGTPPLALSNQK